MKKKVVVVVVLLRDTKLIIFIQLLRIFLLTSILINFVYFLVIR